MNGIGGVAKRMGWLSYSAILPMRLANQGDGVNPKIAFKTALMLLGVRSVYHVDFPGLR
jgi:hypothetical protein